MRFSRVAGTVFAVVAVLHAYRAIQQLPLQIGSTAIPIWVSWVGALVAALLSAWGFRARG